MMKSGLLHHRRGGLRACDQGRGGPSFCKRAPLMRNASKLILTILLGLLLAPVLGGCQSSSGTQYLNSTPPPGPNARPLAPNRNKKLPGPAKMQKS
ncbi:MAG TPA: hypothetical protein VFJ58_27645 [Armatimonadota bacterium]|nr:hypothetical protein [Armatimonadota bacterium]